MAKPLGFFHKQKNTKDGLRPSCGACKSEARKIFYQANKEIIISHQKLIRLANPEKQKRWQTNRNAYYCCIANSANYRAKKFNISEKLYGIDVLRIHTMYNSMCILCGSKVKVSIDHVIPLSLGGANAFHNLQLLCKVCNSLKYRKTIDYRLEALQAS